MGPLVSAVDMTTKYVVFAARSQPAPEQVKAWKPGGVRVGAAEGGPGRCRGVGGVGRVEGDDEVPGTPRLAAKAAVTRLSV